MNTLDRFVVHPRCISIVAIASLLLFSGGASPLRPPANSPGLDISAPTDGLTKLFSGQIVGIHDETLMIVDAEGQADRFRVAEAATIMLNGAESSLDSLSTGLHATIMAESRGGEWVATSVDARHQY